jgi:predicted ATPase
MDTAIRTLIVKRFRSFQSARLDFDNPTFLVGRNGSGKSNLVDAFAFLSEAMSVPLQAVFDRRGGISVVRNRTSGPSYPPNLGLAVVFGGFNGSPASGRYAFEVKALPDYGFEVVREQCVVRQQNRERAWFERQGGHFSSSVKDLHPNIDPSALALPVVGGHVRFAPVLRALSAIRVHSIEPAKLREMQDPDSGTSLKADGSNTASVLKEIERQSSDDAERICEILESIVPNTRSVRVKKHGNKLTLEFTQAWDQASRRTTIAKVGEPAEANETRTLRFEAFSMSDGTLRALGLLAAVFQRPSPTLLAIEEPEATIHPGALAAVLDLLKGATKRMQVVITTHSPDVLEQKWIQDGHIRIVDWIEGASRIAVLSDAAREALKQHLMGAGELLRSNALDPQPLFDLDPSQASLFESLA